MSIITQRDFTCTTQGHHKAYAILIEDVPGGYQVRAVYGAIGATPQQTVKTKGPVTLEAAQKLVASLVKEKQAKGYIETGASGVQMSAVTARESSGILPQLLNEIDDEELGRLLADDDWGLQEKKNGRRMLVEKIVEVRAINRKGEVVSAPEAVMQAVVDLPTTCLLDGESIGEVYWCFDMLEVGEEDIRRRPFAQRHLELCTWILPNLPNLKVVPLYKGTAAKTRAFASLKAANAEGVVFKRLATPYVPGRPASGGDQVKWKFWHEADVVIKPGREGKRSTGMYVFDLDGNQVDLGNVTIPSNYDMPRSGDVATVKYLYCQSSLYQPQWLGVRDDKRPEECLVTQIKYKPEETDEDA